LISINTLQAECAPNGRTQPQLEMVMAYAIDLVQLACDIAAIASTTRDPETGRHLVKLVDRLLTASGLPLAGHPGAV
jgi:hypothetical protein